MQVVILFKALGLLLLLEHDVKAFGGQVYVFLEKKK
jgi:hypothetical protein